MLCQECRRADATEHITAVLSDGADARHYCGECWARLALGAYESALRHLDEQFASMSPLELTQARRAAPRLRSMFRQSPEVLAALEAILIKHAIA